ncbi:hypothetical protein niasHS_015175 [Heterodera schachtii]|uniref:Uncharacterized protein n=1 Tax=Heterodera schachtii TaxID=97005 RepID=A0ABD2I924_HETSC
MVRISCLFVVATYCLNGLLLSTTIMAISDEEKEAAKDAEMPAKRPRKQKETPDYYLSSYLPTDYSRSSSSAEPDNSSDEDWNAKEEADTEDEESPNVSLANSSSSAADEEQLLGHKVTVENRQKKEQSVQNRPKKGQSVQNKPKKGQSDENRPKKGLANRPKKQKSDESSSEDNENIERLKAEVQELMRKSKAKAAAGVGSSKTKTNLQKSKSFKESGDGGKGKGKATEEIGEPSKKMKKATKGKGPKKQTSFDDLNISEILANLDNSSSDEVVSKKSKAPANSSKSLKLSTASKNKQKQKQNSSDESVEIITPLKKERIQKKGKGVKVEKPTASEDAKAMETLNINAGTSKATPKRKRNNRKAE